MGPEDDEASALAHQQELENWQWLLMNDPAYEQWLNQTKDVNNEIPSETVK